MEQRVFKSGTNWLDARLGGLSASESAAVLGLNPYQSRAATMKKKLSGVSENLENNPAVAAGKAMEAAVVWRWQLEGHMPRGYDCTIVDPGPYTLQVSSDHPWLIATCDRLVCYDSLMGWYRVDPSRALVGPLEVKVGSHEIWGKAGAPAYYVVQLQHQMLVTGAEGGWLAALSVPKDKRDAWNSLDRREALELFTEGKLYSYEFERDEKLHERIIQEGGAFMRELYEKRGVDIPKELAA